MIQIDYLKNQPQFIPDIAEAFFKEWSHLMPGATIEAVVARLQERLNTDRIPLAFVAFTDTGEWVGTAQLKEHDMDERPNLFPWFAGFYVQEKFRKQGVGEQLLNAVIKKSILLGIPKLYLFTEHAESYYARRGWKLIERLHRGNSLLSVMELSAFS